MSYEKDSYEISKDEIEERLSLLEQAVLEPVIPGEALAWHLRVQPALEAALKSFTDLGERHEADFESILENDPEISQRVILLKEREQELSEALRGHLGVLASLRIEEESRISESEEPVDKLNDLRNELVVAVAHCKAHHRDVESWFMESLYRDRGTQD